MVKLTSLQFVLISSDFASVWWGSVGGFRAALRVSWVPKLRITFRKSEASEAFRRCE